MEEPGRREAMVIFLPSVESSGRLSESELYASDITQVRYTVWTKLTNLRSLDSGRTCTASVFVNQIKSGL